MQFYSKFCFVLFLSQPGHKYLAQRIFLAQGVFLSQPLQ